MKANLENISTLFMGTAPAWYKAFIAAALSLNTISFFCFGPFITGWIILVEFLLVLGFSLQSYPLFPGGLLALQVLILNMTTSAEVIREIHTNMDVILLLIFLVPAIYFIKPLLQWLFIRLFAATRNKVLLSLIFLGVGAFMSAWLDALTVLAVIIAVCMSVRDLYQNAAAHNPGDAEEFNGFLRNLLMHGAVGTAAGGVATLIGEPQNILIAHYAGWDFGTFYLKMAHFSIPVQIASILTCVGLETFRIKLFGFGYQLPDKVAVFLEEYARQDAADETRLHRTRLCIMAGAFVCLMLALAFQIAPIGIIGLGMLILLPLLTGQTDEHKLGDAFKDSLPFTALIVIFFVIVAMIGHLGLFDPVTALALKADGKGQVYAFFLASGILSAVSDNVFVATIYIHEASKAMAQGLIDNAQFDRLAIAINAGTNIFSIITPNGQAAFLFLLTSALARKIQLSYVRMFWLAFPYAVVLVVTALYMV